MVHSTGLRIRFANPLAEHMAVIKSDTETISTIIHPIKVVRHEWNQSIVQSCCIEPAVLHLIIGAVLGTIAALNGHTLSGCNEIVQRHKTTGIGLINRKMQNVQDATSLSTVITIVLILALEVSE